MKRSDIQEVLKGISQTLFIFTEAARDTVLAPIVKTMEQEMAEFFLLQGRLFLKGLENHKGKFQESTSGWDAGIFVTVEKATSTTLKKIIEKGSGKAIGLAMNDMKQKFGTAISLNLKDTRAIKYMTQNGGAMVTGINETTRDYIRTILTEGLDKGWSYKTTANAIKERFKEFAVGQPQKHIGSRAELVSVTENKKAYGEGKAIFADSIAEQGIDMEKSWLTSNDSLVSDECQGNQDEGWIPIDQQFSSGDDQEPAHPACRCTCLYQTNKSQGD